MKKLILVTFMTSLFATPTFAEPSKQAKVTQKSGPVATSPVRPTKKSKTITVICDGLARPKK